MHAGLIVPGIPAHKPQKLQDYRRSALKGKKHIKQNTFSGLSTFQANPQEFSRAIPVTRNPLYEENGGE